MAGIEKGRNNLWAQWYPGVVPNFREIPVEGSPYQEPNNETLAVFAQLRNGSIIGDIAGGDGRFALPLARMGHHVIVTDVDMPHLLRAKEKGNLDQSDGRIYPIMTDATTQFPIKDGSLDAVLNAGFGYLIPPDELDPLFEKIAKILRPGGLMVFEFATDRDRRATRDSENSLIGEKEYNYGHDEGISVLKTLFEKHHIDDFTTQNKIIHFEKPYFMHNNLLIAHGIKH